MNTLNLNKLKQTDSSVIPRRQEQTISQLLARLVISIMIPLLAFSALLLWRFTEAQQERAENEARLAATKLAKDLDREVNGFIAALSGLATSPALISNDLAHFYEQAKQVAALVRAPILLEDAASGRQLLNTRRPFGFELPDSEPSSVFAAVVAAKQPVVSDLIFGLVAQRQLVVVAVPVVQGGEVRSVLMLSIEPKRLVAVMDDQQLAANWTTSLIDRQGTMIARSRDLDAFVGRPSGNLGSSTGASGVDRVANHSGVAVLRGYARTEHGWMVSAFTPVSFIDGPLRESWLAFLAIGVVILALALPLTLFYAGRIANSIREVASLATALERGEVVPLSKTDIHEAAKVSEILSAASITLRERTRMLAESAARFKSAFEQAAVGFEQTDLNGRWLTLNNRFCQMLGYTREECLSLSSQTLTHPEDHLVEAPLLKRLVHGDVPSTSIEKRYFTKAGSVVWVRSTTSLVRDLDGAPLYFVSVVEDITTGQTARALTARLAALVQASNDAIISLTPEGLIETWNPGAERLFGYGESEILGEHFAILGPDDRPTDGRSFFHRGLAGESFRVETEVVRKDASVFDATISVSPIITKDESVTALSVTIEDISERRQWERRMMLLNREMQHRVKNSLAVVQSIANQTIRSSTTTEGFRTAFQGRLQALSAANDLLLQSVWTGSDLASIIDQQMKPLLSDPQSQLQTHGPSVALPADLTVPLGLALHELGTNALKYGSLSAAGGRIEIHWKVTLREGKRELFLNWTEIGGPAATPSNRRGFGSTLILRGIPGAVVEHRLEPSGLVCIIAITLENPPAEQFAAMSTA